MTILVMKAILIDLLRKLETSSAEVQQCIAKDLDLLERSDIPPTEQGKLEMYTYLNLLFFHNPELMSLANKNSLAVFMEKLQKTRNFKPKM